METPDDPEGHSQPEAVNPGQVTRLLHRVGAGDSDASDELLEVVYDHLRAIAAGVFGHGGAGQTLQPTVLVHDAYLKLVGSSGKLQDRGHFYSVAALAMRQMLRDHARARGTQKRGGRWRRVSFAQAEEMQEHEDVDLVQLDGALEKLSTLSQRQARIVELRFLTGLSIDDTAAILKVSAGTVGNEWRMARAFLRRELSRDA